MKMAAGVRLSAIGYRLSAIGYRLSAIGYRLSAIGYRLSAIGYRLSAISQSGEYSPCHGHSADSAGRSDQAQSFAAGGEYVA